MISKNAIIGFLIFSGLVLAVVLGLDLGLGTDRAYGATSSRAGVYVVSTASVDRNEDLLWIADVSSRQLVVLRSDRNGSIVDLARVDLVEIFGNSDEDDGQDDDEGDDENERNGRPRR